MTISPQSLITLPELDGSMGSGGLWRRVRATRTSDEIVAQFRQALFEGELHPGDSVGSEAALAKQFGVSRISIRDALRTLEASGIVEIRVGAKGGTRIAQGDPQRFADALAVQLALVGVTPVEALDTQMGIEWVAAQLAASSATPQDLQDLDGLLKDARGLTEQPTAFAESGVAFHAAIAAASHNRVIVATLTAIRGVIRQLHVHNTTPTRVDHALRVHAEILQAIRDRDPLEAGKLMQQHIGLTRASAAGRAK